MPRGANSTGEEQLCPLAHRQLGAVVMTATAGLEGIAREFGRLNGLIVVNEFSLGTVNAVGEISGCHAGKYAIPSNPGVKQRSRQVQEYEC
jgi:hypothetical protein